MVLKIAGSLLVTCSCGALGLWKAAQWKDHLGMLEQLRKMIVLLRSEILYAHTPLGEALGHVGRKSEGVLAGLFGAFSPELATWLMTSTSVTALLPLSARGRGSSKTTTSEG